MRSLLLIFLSALFVSSYLTSPVWAVIQFQKEFYRVYGIDKKAEKKTEFATAALKAKCYICHQGKKSKKNHNPYGEQLEKLLDHKKDKKNPEKIEKALQKAAKALTNPKDKKSPTYGDLIKKGKLPGGPLKEVMKEPKKKETKKDDSDSKPKESNENEGSSKKS